MIITKELKSILVLAFITMALFASGCTEKNLSAEEIATQMLDKQNSIQNYSYTMHMTSYAGGRSSESEFKTMFKKPNLSKTIITEPGKEYQIIIVSDGEFTWSYIPDINEVTKTKLPDIPEPTQNDYINAIGLFLNSSKVTLIGTENIDGRTTYLLETTLKETNETSQPISQLLSRTKIWVDKETWMILRSEIYDKAGNLTIKIEIQDLKVNSGIPDSEFKFEVPEGAKIVEPKEIKPPAKLSLEEAGKKVSFKILTPKHLPEGYEFDNAMVYNNSRFSQKDQISESVGLTYINKDDSIDITETAYENQSFDTEATNDGEDIEINEIEGKYVSMDNLNVMTWKQGNVDLILCAPLEKDELLKIAESISDEA